MIEPILDGANLYRAARQLTVAVQNGIELQRVEFVSRNAQRLLPCDRAWNENQRFGYFLFLPARLRSDAVAVILNGLNDSSYRKFFPWAASLARAGLPALIFPTAMLMNRRPRAWITPAATARAFAARSARVPDATATNAVLSARVAEQPLSQLHDALQTADDVADLAGQLHGGDFALSDGSRPFPRGTRVHLLGYSLGGYVALALQVLARLPPDSRVVTFCSGAAVRGSDSSRASPVSPYILDSAAAALLLAELDGLHARLETLDPVGRVLVQLLTGSTPALREQLARLGQALTVYASRSDRVVPAEGIVANLGRVDAVFDTGCHEYPFNLSDLRDPNASRLIANSHRVGRNFETEFRLFVAAVARTFSADYIDIPPLTAST